MNLDYLIHLAKRGTINIHPGGERATRALVHALDFHPHDRVLEIGCGTGWTMLRILESHAVTVIGLEFLPEMLHVAHRRLHVAGKSGHAHLLRAHAVKLPFPDRSIDRVYCESVLGFQEVASVVEMLQEIHRVLRVGGLFVANEAIWKPHLDQQVVAAINRRCEADFGLRQATDQGWSLTEWLDAAQAAQFRLRSADLLQVHLNQLADGADQSAARPYWTSRLFTLSVKLRNLLDLKYIHQHLRYCRLLQEHRQDGSYLEERLFILENG